MSEQVKIRKPAKTPTKPLPVYTEQLSVVVPEREVERPDLVTQLGNASRPGHNFSSVRVYASVQADAFNQQLSAGTFTTGKDIFFQQGEHPLGTSGSQEVVAHELTPVIQRMSWRCPRTISHTNPVTSAYCKTCTDNQKRATVLIEPNIFIPKAAPDKFRNAVIDAINELKKQGVWDRIKPTKELWIDQSGSISSGGVSGVGSPNTEYLRDKKDIIIGSVIEIPANISSTITADLLRQARGTAEKVGTASGEGIEKEEVAGVTPWPIVIGHELVHAKLAEFEIDRKLEFIQTNAKGLMNGWRYKEYMEMEEALVTGICRNVRLSISENATRTRMGKGIRAQYGKAGSLLNIAEEEQKHCLTLPDTMSIDIQIETVLTNEFFIPAPIAELVLTKGFEDFKSLIAGLPRPAAVEPTEASDNQ